MSTNFSIYSMIASASIVVQAVLVILVIASIFSWAVIFRKYAELKRAEANAAKFEGEFWSGADLGELYKRLDSRASGGGLAEMFRSGFREFARLIRHGHPGAANALANARRAMAATRSRELDRLETSMGYLATVGSTAPYVGLFGTVWGIMAAFQGLGNAEQATLAMVAPGISEALIATAMGLIAAIPATIFYNRFANQVDRLDGRYESFTEEFTNVLEHHRVAEGDATS
ncbi:MAG TPA: protein TolQ [Gammaproteobacteria bacterium]|nr:protein TolQ [Gammaproteobacteria bacterium]